MSITIFKPTGEGQIYQHVHGVVDGSTGPFELGVMLWEEICQRVGDRIIVWNRDSQQTPLSLSAGV